MAENPQFFPPTNQILFHNNFPLPNSIPNQITQLGFGHFYHHDQEQQQRRIWAGQQISNSHYKPQGRERIENGLMNNNAVSDSLYLPPFPVNFSLGHNGNYGKVGGIMGEEEDNLIEQFGFDGRNSNLTVVPHYWRNQGEKPPSFRTFPITEVLNRNNKRCMGSEEINNEAHKQNQKRFKSYEESLLLVADPARKILDNNGDVETIYGSSTIEQTNKMNQEPVQDQSEAINKNGDGKEESMADLFNRLVNRVIHHQESLHQRLLEAIKRIDEKLKEREEAWRKEELARLNHLTIVRERDQALASSREATIISYLEKITGQSMIIPRKTNDVSSADNMNVNKRWRKIEVETLIRFRTSLEPKFCDPALKDFLWEEISKLMGSMGYIRSGQRCKEKWANINGYYKKAKESSKVQRNQKFKSCPYFQQLDQFYTSKSFTNGSSSSFSSMHQGRNLIAFGNVEENRELRNVNDDRKLNYIVEVKENDEEEGSDAD